MNASNAKDYLPLVHALAEGKVIQIVSEALPSGWMDLDDPLFVESPCLYRIKPEPREIWVNEYPNHPSVIHPTRMDAINCAMADAITRRYREVIG